MWYEILPSVGIVFACLAMPLGFNAALNKIVRGKNQVRIWDRDLRDFHMFLRDRRLTGDLYTVQGLEALPEDD